MTKYHVTKGRAFDNDMERIHTYMLHGNYYESTIKSVFEAFYRDLQRLRTSPKIGEKLSSRVAIPNDYRYLMSGDYLIFYKLDEKENLVQVIHVYHGRENYLAKLNLN